MYVELVTVVWSVLMFPYLLPVFDGVGGVDWERKFENILSVFKRKSDEPFSQAPLNFIYNPVKVSALHHKYNNRICH